MLYGNPGAVEVCFPSSEHMESPTPRRKPLHLGILTRSIQEDFRIRKASHVPVLSHRDEWIFSWRLGPLMSANSPYQRKRVYSNISEADIFVLALGCAFGIPENGIAKLHTEHVPWVSDHQLAPWGDHALAPYWWSLTPIKAHASWRPQ
jgi:hypothetical protein